MTSKLYKIGEFFEKIKLSIQNRPGTWFLAILLIVTAYFNHKISKSFTDVCETLIAFYEENHENSIFDSPYIREMLDKCENHISSSYYDDY